MNLENQLLEKFQVEELEKRYEFSWIDEIKCTLSATVPVNNNGATVTGSVSTTINLTPPPPPAPTPPPPPGQTPIFKI